MDSTNTETYTQVYRDTKYNYNIMRKYSKLEVQDVRVYRGATCGKATIVYKQQINNVDVELEGSHI